MSFKGTASTVNGRGYSWHHKWNKGLSMAEDLNCEESDYKSDHADSVCSSKSKCLSCEFSSFKGGSSGSEAADGATAEPFEWQHWLFRSADEESVNRAMVEGSRVK